MSKIAPQPSCPTEWQEYANSEAVANLPLRQDQSREGPVREIFLIPGLPSWAE